MARSACHEIPRSSAEYQAAYMSECKALGGCEQETLGAQNVCSGFNFTNCLRNETKQNSHTYLWHAGTDSNEPIVG